jgi:glyoxylase-like metal-dependent hydrolase (beta-lactamase superfamily II)
MSAGEMNMKRLLCLFSLLLLPATCLAAEDLFDIKPIADGVYAAIAKPAYKVNCNAAIILLDDAVLVVDTHSKPSAARALIEQIKKLTDKPVRYVVNTHFHWDHYQGNQAYPSSWPAGVEIISSEATRANIEQRGIPRVKHEIVTMPQEIEKLKSDLDKASDLGQKEQFRANLLQAEAYLAELKSMQVTLPSLTFDHSLILHRPSKTVEILWLGNAHTNGDVFVYLPREKVLITGDALHGWTPYMGDSYPFDWIQTLDAAEKLDFDQVIGGHGDVMRGKERFDLWKHYFRDLMDEAAQAYARGASLEDAEKGVSKTLIAKYADKFDPGFPKSVFGNIAKAYQVIASMP